MVSAGDRVPVTIIGGYLGAGKTTLINQLLTADHGRRLAVLVNDFGSVNIDADLIEEHDGETISLTNGCICCSIADALGDCLDQVLALDPAPDHIVIEASGVADPASIATYGQGWPGCRLDAIVVLADGEAIRNQARDQFVGELVTRQLARADLVVVTKTDLVSVDQAHAVLAWVGEQTSAVTLAASNGQVDAALVLDAVATGAFDAEACSVDGADDLFATVVIDMSEPIDRAQLEHALEAWPHACVRVKGFVSVLGGDLLPATHVVHRVGRRWSIERAPASTTAAMSLVCIVRRDLDEPEQLLRSMLG